MKFDLWQIIIRNDFGIAQSDDHQKPVLHMPIPMKQTLSLKYNPQNNIKSLVP